MQTFGEKACHPEGNEGSGSARAEILRFPQDDRRDLLQARSQVALSPNVCDLWVYEEVNLHAGSPPHRPR